MEKFETPALLFCVDGKHLENGTFRKRWRHDNLMVSWKRCVFNSSGLGWKKDISSFKKTEEKMHFNFFHISVKSRLYGETLSRWRGSPSQPSQLQRAFIWEIRWPLYRSQELTTALTQALIVSPWLSWLGWLSQSVYMEKSGPTKRVTLPSKKGDPVTLKFWQSQLFVPHVDGWQILWRNMGKVGSGLTRVGE